MQDKHLLYNQESLFIPVEMDHPIGCNPQTQITNQVLEQIRVKGRVSAPGDSSSSHILILFMQEAYNYPYTDIVYQYLYYIICSFCSPSCALNFHDG